MKTLKTGLISFIALVAFTGLQAQTVDEIINKYITAIGGKDKLNSIKTLYYESSIDVMGNEATSTTYIINGKGMKSETDFNGQKIVQVVTENGGWMINPMMGQTTAGELPKDQMKGSQSQYTMGGGLLDYAAKGNKVELVGREDVSGVSTYKIKLTTKDSAIINYFIDPTTYYVSKVVSTISAQGQDAETSIIFSNYQKTDFGYVHSMKQELSLPQGISLTITTKKVEINKDIDPKIFEMPKS